VGIQWRTYPFGVPMIRRHCPCCDAANQATPPSRYDVAPWQLLNCSACGLTYLRLVPDYAAQVTTLAWERTSKLEEVRRQRVRPLSYGLSKHLRWRLHLLPRRSVGDMLARLAAPGNVIDLGCGSGDQLTELPAGFVPFGIEISAALARAGNAKVAALGGRVINAPSLHGLQRFDAGFFSAALLRSYLEHERQPREVLTALHRVLAPSGVAIVKVPNYASWNRVVMGQQWCGFRWPDHMNHFTPATLAELARRAGFVTRFGLLDRLPTSDNMWAVLRKA